MPAYNFRIAVFTFVVTLLIGGAVGGAAYWKLNEEVKQLRQNLPASQRIAQGSPEGQDGYLAETAQEERIIQVVKDVSPAVVSIILTRDEPVFEQILRDPFEDFFGGPSPFQIRELEQKGTEKREIGGGSGFLVSEDGMIFTNKHVVLHDDVEYTVLTKDGESYAAEVLARDPVQDLAVIKIEGSSPFPFVELGNSDKLEIGQSVITIGNALGEFRNTVSVGVISGLGRTITASDGQGFLETIEDVVQTDAAINRGNSGGPLLNLAGEVVGVNTATVMNAQNIGFAIPSNRARRGLYQVRELGEIVYPFLGVEYELRADFGVLIVDVLAESAAENAGLEKDDVLVEFDGKKITLENSLGSIMQQYEEADAKPVYNPGDTVELKVLRGEEELMLSAILGEREE